MNLVRISVYGEGYYSGNEYNEIIYLLEEDYKKLKTDLNEKEIDLGELDEKHSEVDGKIHVKLIPKEKQLNYNFSVKNDGVSLYYKLDEIQKNEKLKIDDMINKANNYIKKLDSLVKISFNIRKSQVKKIKDLISNNL